MYFRILFRKSNQDRAMSRKFQNLLNEYSESHQNHTNKIIHWICVPLIFWSIVALFYSIPDELLKESFGDHFIANWAIIVLVPVILYYFSLSASIAIGMMFFISICLFISELVLQNADFPLWGIAIFVFIISWIGQFYGHKVEGKKPSFLKDIQFLLIGPAWLMHFIYKRCGIKY